MTTGERATLAFRILGIYCFVITLHFIGLLAQSLLARIGLMDAPLPFRWTTAIFTGSWIGLGILLLLFAGWLSRLATRALEGSEDLHTEATALACVLVGVTYLFGTAVLVEFLLVDREWGSLPLIAVAAAVGLALVAGAPGLARWVRNRSLPYLDAPAAAFATLFVGILVICIRSASFSLVGVLGTFTLSDAFSPGEQRMLLAERVTNGGLVLMLVVVCVGFLAEIASRGARRGPAPPGGRVLPTPPGAWVCLTAAILLGAFYHLPPAIRALVELWPVGWSVPGAVARVVWGIVATGLAGCAVAFVWGPIARWLAARVYRPDPDEGAERASARLILEVGITLLVLWHLISRTFGVYSVRLASEDWEWSFWLGWHYWLAPALTLILLAFRGDIARIWMRPGGPEELQAGRRRAAALYPWLVLLGVWTLFRSVPSAAVSTIQRATGIQLVLGSERPMLLVQVALGAVLVVLAGPLSRLLSFGPILLRKRPEPADE